MNPEYCSGSAFLDAWLDGVELAGPHYFKKEPGYGSGKWNYVPNFDDIDDAIGRLSSGEAVFLASMYTFYNAHAGGKMLKQLRVDGLGDIAAALDEPRLRVLAALLVSYEGW